MMHACPFILLAALALSGCATTGASDGLTPTSGDTPASGTSLPTGSRLSTSGYLTIIDVPPSPFPATPPPEPRVIDDFARRTSSPDPATRAKAWEGANGTPAFQAELQRLREVVSREQPNTFVDVRLVRDPAVAAEFWFTHDAARTLARYTSDPQFRPRQGGVNQAEKERLQTLWAARMEGGNLINLLSIDPFTGVVELGIRRRPLSASTPVGGEWRVMGLDAALHPT